MKAPIITAPGCPSCGLPVFASITCAACIRSAHGEAVRATHPTLQRIDNTSDLGAATRAHEDARAAWAGADLLLDELGLLLLRVGFEVPAVARTSRR